MSTPQPIRNSGTNLPSKRLAAERRSDFLYVAGAVLICIGLGGVRWYLASIAAGSFAILLPLLELITGFIRGLRPRAR